MNDLSKWRRTRSNSLRPWPDWMNVLPHQPSADRRLDPSVGPRANLRVYGTDAAAVRVIAHAEPGSAEGVHPELPYREAGIVWAVCEEMARTVEDVLSRRTRALLLGAQASIECAPRCRAWLAL
jgi:glycerol-3-phosphate dehydrogenase